MKNSILNEIEKKSTLKRPAIFREIIVNFSDDFYVAIVLVIRAAAGAVVVNIIVIVFPPLLIYAF